MLLGTVSEVVSLGMVLPFLGALTAPDEVFSHALMQPLINLLDLNSSAELVLPLSILFALAAIISGLIRLALLWVQTHLGNAIGNDLGSAAYRKTLYQPYAVHSARNSSQIIAVLMTKINTVVYFVIIPFLTLISASIIVATVVGFMFFVDPQMTTVALLSFGLIYFAVAYFTKKHLASNSQLVTLRQNEVAQVVQEGLGGIRDVIIDGLQETYFRIYRRVDWQMRRALSIIAILGGAPRPVIEAFGMVLIAILAYILTQREEGLAAALPVLGTLALAAQRLLPLVQQGYASWASMAGGKASLVDVLELLEQEAPPPSAQIRHEPLLFNDRIQVSDLTFSYHPQEGKPVLQKLDLTIERGARVGFIGETGSGKSTLLDLIMGLLFASSGEISIDNTALDLKTQRSWQARIAHVPQSIFLTDGSIAENIAFGVRKEHIDWTRLKVAAEKAQISGAIEALNDGYDTFVGERGIRLSGGQRQRIGIARALYKKADVLVLDEATSALDVETEAAVMKSFEDMDETLTILMVAHRVSTLKNCDYIVELKSGRVSRVGNFQEIIGG
ncbi:ABC transporter ATP-binding protein [Thalassospira indica]|uniref:ABC transporter ATP-binding protein n=2 Tax=Thalassospira indica TaxID=1891279 RepID=A0ABN5NLS6_9PROT|nr:ABC transporter ATP-binding protein [Thalassospira indica]